MTGLPDWPVYGWADDVRPAMAEARAEGEAVALATILSAEGGAPRPPGTQMLISQGRLSGFLSGGCVEGDVAGHALACLGDGEPRRLVYGEGSPYPDIQLLCGGRIELLVEALEPDDPAVEGLLQAGRERRRALYTTDGRRRAASSGSESSHEVAPDMFHVKRWYDPLTRLIVVGADPTALAIAALSAVAGFETWLVRPKGPVAQPPLENVRYDRRPATEALTGIGLDPWTAVAVATHDLESDQEALMAALPSSAFYVGVLGARRRVPERLARLGRSGIQPWALERLKAPIGLDLGGKAPFEIATAVIAEIIAARQSRHSKIGASFVHFAGQSRGSRSTSTRSPTQEAFALAGRRRSESALANTATSDES